MTPRKAAPKPTPPPPVNTMDPKVVRIIPLGDNRQIRILKIPTDMGESRIRVGINLMPSGENMSGAVFPESAVQDVISGLMEVRSA